MVRRGRRRWALCVRLMRCCWARRHATPLAHRTPNGFGLKKQIRRRLIHLLREVDVLKRYFSRTGLRAAVGLGKFSVGDFISGLDDRPRRAWFLGGHLRLPVSVKQPPARLFLLPVPGQKISIVPGCLSSLLSPLMPSISRRGVVFAFPPPPVTFARSAS